MHPCLMILLWLVPSLAAAAAPAEILVLYNADDRNLPLPPCDACVTMDVNAPQSLPRPPRAVIASGHAEHGRYLGLLTDDFVWLLRSVGPALEWLVIDACLSAQADLLLRLESGGVDVPVVIGTTNAIPASGIDYGHLLTGDGDIDARELRRLSCCEHGSWPLTRIEGRPQIRALIEDTRAQARRCALSEPLAQVLPNLYPARSVGVEGRLLVAIPLEDWPVDCEARR